MKKSILVLVIAVFAVNIVKAQNDWINYKIDNKLSVKLPAQPAPTDAYSVMAQGKDSSTYVVSIIDLQKVAKVDSATLAALAPTPNFYNSIKTGMLAKMPGTTLGDVTPGKWKGYYCYNFEGGNTVRAVKVYVFMVIIGTNIYSLAAVVHTNSSAAGKDSFFSSLVLN